MRDALYPYNNPYIEDVPSAWTKLAWESNPYPPTCTAVRVNVRLCGHKVFATGTCHDD
jgi:hypothetical protein